MDPQSILNQRLQQSQQNEKTFSDRLRERRGFVSGQEATASPIFERLLEAPNGEARVASTDIINPLRGFTTENTRMIQGAEDDLTRAGATTDNLLQTLIQLSESQKDRSLKERELSLKESGGTDIKELLEIRAKLKDQGLDTNAVDTQLALSGINPETGIPQGKQEIIDEIDNLLEGNTGAITGLRGLIPDIPGTSAALALNNLEHLKAKLSLENVGKLKGQGQVSDKEREMLEKASSKLSQRLSNDQLRNELQILRDNLSGTAKKRSKDEDPLKLF